MRIGGVILIIFGGVFTLYSVISLKNSLTPSPQPREEGNLITSGLYGIVRHPAYSSILLMALGFSVSMNDFVRLILTVILAIFFDAKSRVEERLLEKTYPKYAPYKKQVTKKFIPWIY